MSIPAYPDWLNADALTVAPRLLGCELVSYTPAGSCGGKIVEVEAYYGPTDPASHAYRGKTSRNAPMFDSGGTLYIYLSYGIHFCLNLVTGPNEAAQAVLIRALEPTLNIELMQQRRGHMALTNLTTGPGKLTQALGLTQAQSGQHLGQSLRLIEHPHLASSTIRQGARIGIRQGREVPWRYWINDNPFVSRI